MTNYPVNNQKNIYSMNLQESKGYKTMLGLIIVSLLGLGMAGSLILWVIVASKKQADFIADRMAQADAITAKLNQWQRQTSSPRTKTPVQFELKPVIPPVV